MPPCTAALSPEVLLATGRGAPFPNPRPNLGGPTNSTRRWRRWQPRRQSPLLLSSPQPFGAARPPLTDPPSLRHLHIPSFRIPIGKDWMHSWPWQDRHCIPSQSLAHRRPFPARAALLSLSSRVCDSPNLHCPMGPKRAVCCPTRGRPARGCA